MGEVSSEWVSEWAPGKSWGGGVVLKWGFFFLRCNNVGVGGGEI